jgi:hypothetical protein
MGIYGFIDASTTQHLMYIATNEFKEYPLVSTMAILALRGYRIYSDIPPLCYDGITDDEKRICTEIEQLYNDGDERKIFIKINQRYYNRPPCIYCTDDEKAISNILDRMRNTVTSESELIDYIHAHLEP